MIPVFDFGGVIVDLRKTATIEAFDRLGFDIRPYLGTYKQGGIFAQLENGDITTANFYDEIRRISANPTLTDEAIRTAWEAYLVGVPAERLACLRRVKQNYRTAVLSNTNPIHWAQAERDYFGTATPGPTTSTRFSSPATCTFRNPTRPFSSASRLNWAAHRKRFYSSMIPRKIAVWQPQKVGKSD